MPRQIKQSIWPTPYPWQKDQWLQLINLASVPCALLFTGQPGIGKTNLALCFANFLLCNNSTEKGSCGNCTTCKLLEYATHPDLIIVTAEEKSSVIKIEQIRNLINQIQQANSTALYKIVIIKQAETLNIAAANALLKILEEPPINTIFILISSKVNMILRTVISRCTKINCYVPPLATAKTWLQQQLPTSVETSTIDTLLHISNNAPIAALKFAQNNQITVNEELVQDLSSMCRRSVLSTTYPCIEKYITADLQSLVIYLMYWLSCIIKYKMGQGQQLITVVNETVSNNLQFIASQTDLQSLFDYFDYVAHWRQKLQIHKTLNQQLIISDLLLAWSAMIIRYKVRER